MEDKKIYIYNRVLDNIKYNPEAQPCFGIGCDDCTEVFGKKLFKLKRCAQQLASWATEYGRSNEDSPKTIYLAGDLCKKGNVLLREKEAEYIRKYPQLRVYSPIEDKEINDKQNQTVESNKYLCDKIYHKDLTAIRESEYIIMDVDNNSVGTVTELGAIAEFNWFYSELEKILAYSEVEKALNIGYEKCLESKLRAFLDKYPKKKVYFHNTDIRNTEIPEQGFFRGYSLNQLTHGAIRYLNPNGFEKDFETCVDNIVNDKNTNGGR